jgi:hypothetical protein
MALVRSAKRLYSAQYKTLDAPRPYNLAFTIQQSLSQSGRERLDSPFEQAFVSMLIIEGDNR